MLAVSRRTLTRKIRVQAWRRPRRWLSLRAAGAGAVSIPNQIATAKVSATARRGASASERTVRKSPISNCEPTQLLVTTGIDREFVTPRRVEDQEAASYEILQSMDWPTDAGGPDVAAGTPDGLSAFVARILDQLSLSAWLPAAFLSASLALLLQFPHNGASLRIHQHTAPIAPRLPHGPFTATANCAYPQTWGSRSGAG